MNDRRSKIERTAESSILLSTLALINVSWSSEDKSYFDQFVPFVLEVMRTDPGKEWSEYEVASGLREIFGLELPVKVVESLLRRAARTNRVDRKNKKSRLTELGRKENASVVQKRADCVRKENALALALKSFVNTEHAANWETLECETVLVDYIERNAVPILSLNAAPGGHSANMRIAENDYILSDFIYKISESDPLLFEYLDEMVKGSMLASALYGETPDLDRKFSDTTIYVDTPLCLSALGYDSEESEEAVQQLLELARSQGARISCFEHTKFEILGVLEAAQNAVRSGYAQNGEFVVAARFVERKMTVSDIEIQIANIDDQLSRAEIRVEPTPSYVLEFGIDETGLRDCLDQRIHYQNERALDRDVSSISTIYRLRRGKSKRYIEQCRAVLMTSNSALARSCREFFQSELGGFPLVVNDNEVAALLWSKKPLGFPELPRKQVIADCVAALAPSADLWSAVMKEIDRLSEKGEVTEDDVSLMKWAPEARIAIMSATRGSSRNVSEVSVSEALAKVKDKMTAPGLAMLAEASTRAEQESIEVARLEDRSKKLAGDLEESRAIVRSLTSREDSQRRYAHENAKIRARVLKWFVIVLSVLVAVGSVVVMAFLDGLLPKIVSGVFAVVGVFGGVGGFYPQMECWFAERSESKQLGRLGLEKVAES